MAEKKLTLYTDGASRGNPGPASWGFVIYEGTEIIEQQGEKIGEATNNTAEYEAIIAGLEACKRLVATEVILKSDSELIVRQLNGQYKVKKPHLIPLFQKAKVLLAGFSASTVSHVRREENELADALANQALDRGY